VRSTSFVWYRLRWPREVEAERLQALSLVLATSAGAPVVIESIGQAGRVEHRVRLPVARAEVTVEQVRSAMPSLGLVQLAERPVFEAGRSLEVRLTTPQRALRIEQSELVSHALLTALAMTRRAEELILQWQLLGVLPPRRVGSAAEHADSSPLSVADVLLGRRGRLDADGRQALRAKRGLPIWRSVGRIAACAASPAREQALLRGVVNALCLADAPGVHLVVRRSSASRINSPGRSWLAPLRLNTAELVAVSAWPLGATAGLPVERLASRPLPVSPAIPRRGRVLGEATFPGAERPIALNTSDALLHLHLLAPTGGGKSTLMLNLVCTDIAAGRSVVVIEPKSDLIEAILERIPDKQLDDVVLIDPTDSVAPVGLNPLRGLGSEPELVADRLLGMFRALYPSWGPRTNDILGASLTSLARVPGMTLVALPLLLSDPNFRRRIVGQLDDPVLRGFWMSLEGWSEAERAAAIAPTMTRVRPLLMRPQLRAIIGQAEPRFDLSQVFSQRKIVLVNLAVGKIGGEAASLLGSLVMSQLWQAILARMAVPPERRRPAFVYCDEFQSFLNLNIDLADFLAQARGLHVGLTLAHQNLAQLPASLRSAVLANARSRICWQLAAEDAKVTAGGSRGLDADDFQELGAYEVYAQLVVEGAVQPWCSARTLPPPASISDAKEVRERSRERYGVARRTVDAEIEQLIGGSVGTDDLAPQRRHDRGAG